MIGVELEPSLVTFGSENLARTDQPWATIRAADAGRARGAGPRAVRPGPGLRRADAPSPTQLVDQLADGGRLVIPVRGTMTLVTRDGDETTETHHGSYRFVPLR